MTIPFVVRRPLALAVVGVLGVLLLPSSSGAAVIEGEGLSVRFPSKAEGGPVAVRGGEHRIGFALRGARGAFTTTGRTAMVRNALPGVNLRYDVAGSTVKETLRLRGPKTPQTYVFDVTAGGLRAVLQPDDSVVFQDAAGTPKMHASAPFMFDSAKPKPALSRDFDVRLRRVGEGRYVYTMTASRSWLKARERVWPVWVDPTVNLPVGPDLGPDRCDIDAMPNPVEPECTPPPGRFDSTFSAFQVNPGADINMDCRTSVQNANPPADDRSGRAKIRLRLNGCTRTLDGAPAGLFSSFLNTRLLYGAGANAGKEVPGTSVGTSCQGHLGQACGGFLETPTPDVKGLSSGTYVQESTVRFILNEPGHPDPWREPPAGWALPPDTNTPPEPNGQGICASGTTVIRCTNREDVTVINDNETGNPGGAMTAMRACITDRMLGNCYIAGQRMPFG